MSLWFGGYKIHQQGFGTNPQGLTLIVKFYFHISQEIGKAPYLLKMRISIRIDLRKSVCQPKHFYAKKGDPLVKVPFRK